MDIRIIFGYLTFWSFAHLFSFNIFILFRFANPCSPSDPTAQPIPNSQSPHKRRKIQFPFDFHYYKLEDGILDWDIDIFMMLFRLYYYPRFIAGKILLEPTKIEDISFTHCNGFDKSFSRVSSGAVVFVTLHQPNNAIGSDPVALPQRVMSCYARVTHNGIK